MMPAFDKRDFTFLELYRATRLGSNPSKAFLKFSRFRRTVNQERPACIPSRTRNSNSLWSSCSGSPHSVSWYAWRSGSPSAQSHLRGESAERWSTFFTLTPLRGQTGPRDKSSGEFLSISAAWNREDEREGGTVRNPRASDRMPSRRVRVDEFRDELGCLTRPFDHGEVARPIDGREPPSRDSAGSR